jgi:hypothetical protein
MVTTLPKPKNKPWDKYRQSEPQGRLLEPGWAGAVDEEELLFIQSKLQSDDALSFWWGFKPRTKRRPVEAIKAVALLGDPDVRTIAGWRDGDRPAASTNTISRFETEVLTQRKNLEGLTHMNTQWVDRAMAHTTHRRVILDMDSSESPVHGEQEGAAYNGHFQSVCYHPLFLFNQFGDCEGALLRPGNVHSADRWREVLEPVVDRYLRQGKRQLFRGDAAFAKSELYEFLEARGAWAMLSGCPAMGFWRAISPTC